jgi:short-subunit dehydrogenase
MPNPYFSNYAGSKAYVLNLGASLYGELKPKGVDVTILSPGLTNTPMVADNGVNWNKTPMKAMEPAVVAETGLEGLGKRLLSVPGGRNKMMAFMSKHSPLGMQADMNEKMMRKALDKDKI